MDKFTYEFEEGIPDEDRIVLLLKRDAIQGALNYQSIFWKCIKDSHARNHYKALSYSSRNMCLVQVNIPDIKSMDDQELKDRIIKGDLKERIIP